ncbi:hypothetical protein DFH29DRAFT_1020733 [Suillus ampliporus]|nr:hypothetical protein DFH29DRAFT_1020733 [Suillus ampliporus]
MTQAQNSLTGESFGVILENAGEMISTRDRLLLSPCTLGVWHAKARIFEDRASVGVVDGRETPNTKEHVGMSSVVLCQSWRDKQLSGDKPNPNHSCQNQTPRTNNFYDPQVLPDHGGEIFQHENAMLPQPDVDNQLITPKHWYSKLCRGTLVMTRATLHAYNWDTRKVYQINAHTIRVLDESDLDEEPLANAHNGVHSTTASPTTTRYWGCQRPEYCSFRAVVARPPVLRCVDPR